MKASPEDQKQLLALQKMDTRVQQLDHSVKTLPQLAELEQLHAQASEITSRLNLHEGEREDAELEISRIESDVAVVQARIQRNSERAATATAKDAQALDTDIAALNKRRNDLEEIEFSVMERVEEIEASITSVQAERDEVRQRQEALESTKADLMADIDREREKIQQDRAALVNALPADLVELYEKQRARYGVGAGLLQGGVSQGSNMALTPTDLQAIRNTPADEVVLCPESACILVRTDESGL
ncbi:zinc ribbon domain-containing protein [Homoserinimonas sp. OAct 916]|uniref:zinc ribbon domain-containing protein n=1 Tax=Homoserinimonas sp. OAct 916 TaxID=2211450 RepID=UPI000DBE8B29|nr:C4-type zinc ribbon domain-containing protein [Homoserinimonas sp. OAct 916]